MASTKFEPKMQAFYDALVARAQEIANHYAKLTGRPYQINLDCHNVPDQYVVFRVKYPGDQTDTLAFNLTKAQFQKVRWVKKGFTVAKTQPKTPVTLDNYEFLAGSAGLKGINSGLLVILGSTFDGVRSEVEEHGHA